MYTKFTAENFRGFQALELNDLKRVNLVAGRNNSGKTALMEAMYLLSGDREPRTILRMKSLLPIEYFFLRGMRGPIGPSEIASWSSLFSNFQTANSIKLSARFDEKPNRLLDDQSEVSLKISHVSPDREDFVTILREFEAEDEDDVIVLEFTLDAESKPYRILISKERIRSSRSNSQNLLPSDFMYTGEPTARENIVERFSNMRQSKTVSVLIEALKLIEPRLTGLEILYDNIHADINGLSQLISLSSLGDGMNRITGLMLAMHEISNGIIFVDEIENGIHHSVQIDLWRAIRDVARSKNVQVFATTHSKEMLRAAHEAFKIEDDDEYDFRFHRLDRYASGEEIEAVTYNKFGMDALAEFDFEFEVRG